MERTIFVESIFCPNKYYFITSYNSFQNNINYMVTFHLKFDIILIGWIPDKFIEFKKKIEKFIEMEF